MKILYTLIIYAYNLLILLVSPFHDKARLMIRGRRETMTRLKAAFGENDRVVWFHCASLGEFEQGRPLIEAIRERDKGIKILLSFFSPSGYEVRKNYEHADCIVYLSADTPFNVRKFINAARPEKVIFIKYEFWYNFLSGLISRAIPVYLTSGIFRKSQIFFKFYGSWFRKILKSFSCIYLQDEDSGKLLLDIGISNFRKAGDTRFDRVKQISDAAVELIKVKEFKKDSLLVIAGSSWQSDEEILARFIAESTIRFKLVLAPHEIHESNLRRIEKLFPGSIRFSENSNPAVKTNILIIDNIGLLSSIYRYADIAIIGGGFGKGIHNILEAAVWKVPVLFGPKHNNFREALEILDAGGASTYSDFNAFRAAMDELLTDNSLRQSLGRSAGDYVEKNTGACSVILDSLLTGGC